MKSAISKADLEFASMLELLYRNRSERFLLEKYVTFWDFVGLLCFRQDEVTRDELHVCAVANIVSNIAKGELSELTSGKRELARITKLEFSPEICADAINNLQHHGGIAEVLTDAIDSIYGTARISEALLRINTIETTDPKRRASLSKAYHFVSKGGLDLDESEDVRVPLASRSSLRTFWRKWCAAFPFVHAFQQHQIDLQLWSPINWYGSVEFAAHVEEEADVLVKVIGTARSIQKQMISVLVEAARDRSFLQFPDYVKEISWSAEPLSERQIRIARSYRSE